MTLPIPPGHQVVTARPTVPWGNGVWDQTINRFPSVLIRDAQWVAPPDGAMCYLDDLDLLMVRRNSTWVVMSSFDIQAGTPAITTTAGGTFSINFPRPFTAAPVVQVSNGFDALQALAIHVQQSSLNASGFSGVVYTTAAVAAFSTVRINWIAILL